MISIISIMRDSDPNYDFRETTEVLGFHLSF